MKIIITGANNGLGLHMCNVLLSNGHEVFVISRNTNNLKKIKNSNLKYYQVDIKDYNNIEKVLDEINRISKQIDVLVNNAAVYLKSNLENSDLQDIDNIINTNVKGTIYVTKLTLSKLLNGPGKIIMINSVAGNHAIKNETIYCASKFAIKGFSESLQMELKRKNISITNIHPGGINTTLWNEKNIYPGKISDLLEKNDVCKIIELVINLPNSQIMKNLTTHPFMEDH